MLTPREKSPLPENVPRGGSNPRCCGQRAQTLPTSYSGPKNYYIINDQKSFCISIGRQTVCGVLGTHLQVIAADDLVISSSEQKATVNAHAGHDAIVVMQLPSKPCCLQALTLALSQIVTRSIHAHLAGQPSQFHPQTGLPLHMENHALTVQQSQINTKKCKTFQFWF